MSRETFLRSVSEGKTMDTVVEIGVWRGGFSEQIIKICRPKEFYGVDPYELFPGMVSAPGPEYNTQSDLDALCTSVATKLKKLGHTLIRQRSLDAAKNFADLSIDMVYIDGDHTYEGCMADIQAWWPKVKSGGILMGDDYFEHKTGKGFDFGVIPAVDTFVAENNLTLETHNCRTPQWCIRKP